MIRNKNDNKRIRYFNCISTPSDKEERNSCEEGSHSFGSDDIVKYEIYQPKI